MSLRKFLDFRTQCPLCDNPKLSIYFSSKKKQEHILEENSYIVKTPLYGMNHRRHCDVAYNFNLDDTSFWIDFYTKENSKMENSFPKFLLKKFQDFNSNMKLYNFYKSCNKCYRYNCITNSFKLNLNTGQIDGSFNILSEYLGLAQKNENDYKLFRILNYFSKNETIIEYGKDYTTNSIQTMNENNDPGDDPSYSALSLPLLPFSSEKEMIIRLNKLILFS